MPALSLLALLHLAAAAPLTLDDALALAARRSSPLQLARADERAASVEIRQAYVGVLPRLDLTAGVGFQSTGESRAIVFDGRDFVRSVSPGNDQPAHDLGATLTWTLFDGLANWNLVAASKTRASAATRLLDETSLLVAFDVTRRFYEVVRQQRALEVRRETAALSSELVSRADALFQAGRGTKADTYSARVNLGNDEIAVNAQEAILARARAELASALGLTTDAGLEVAPPLPVAGSGMPEVAAPPPLEELAAEARRRRPLQAARRLEGDAADLEVARARGAWWPSLGLQGSWRRSTPDLNGRFGVFASPSRQYVATGQVVLAWNAFAGGETAAGVARARVQAERAQVRVAEAEQSIAAEVTIAREQLVALRDSVGTAKEILGAAESHLRFARERLEAGVGSQLEVRDATLKLEQARLTWISTVVDLVVARADLNRAVGGGLR